MQIMKSKKLLAGLLSVTILSCSAISVFAADMGSGKTILAKSSTEMVLPISDQLEQENRAYFNSFTGTVKKISDFRGMEGAKFVSVENEKGEPANIIISGETYILNEAELAVGSLITAFYDANAPMIMIYPPQYSAKVVVLGNLEQNIKVDLFDQDLISADRSLKLNISEETEIITQDGKTFTGELANRKLAVIYGASTKSIPAQTTPEKVVVLFEEELPPVEEEKTVERDLSSAEIIVNEQKIEAPAAYLNEEGTVMVPLRAIAEALGFELDWNGKTQRIALSERIFLKIGEDNYTYPKTPVESGTILVQTESTSIQLGAAPELINGTTFVPLNFFREVVQMNNAYLFEGQIVIN
jgi:hypothetical protein